MTLHFTKVCLLTILFIIKEQRPCATTYTNKNGRFLSKLPSAVPSRHVFGKMRLPLMKKDKIKREIPFTKQNEKERENFSTSDQNIMAIDVSHLLKPSLRNNAKNSHPLMQVDLSILDDKMTSWPTLTATTDTITLPADDTITAEWGDNMHNVRCPTSPKENRHVHTSFDQSPKDDEFFQKMGLSSPGGYPEAQNRESTLRQETPEYDDRLVQLLADLSYTKEPGQPTHGKKYEDALTDFLHDHMITSGRVQQEENQDREYEDNTVFPILMDTSQGTSKSIPTTKRSLFISESWKPGGFPDYVISKGPHTEEGTNRNYAYTSVFISNGWNPGGKRMKLLNQYVFDPNTMPYVQENELEATAIAQNYPYEQIWKSLSKILQKRKKESLFLPIGWGPAGIKINSPVKENANYGIIHYYPKEEGYHSNKHDNHQPRHTNQNWRGANPFGIRRRQEIYIY